MENSLIVEVETVRIEGGRNLYNYTFREHSALHSLLELVRRGDNVGPFLELNPGLDLSPVLAVALEIGNEEAVRDIEARLDK